MNSTRRYFLILLSLLLGYAIIYFAAFKTGLIPVRPEVFAALIAVLVICLLVEFVYSLQTLMRKRIKPFSGIARLLLVSGLLLTFSAGMMNWLLSLQGAVILSELEAIPLSRTAHLQEFEAGPLSNVDEMQMTLQLEKLILRPGGGGTFTPFSRLRFLRADKPPVILEVAPGKSAGVGTLYFHQGAFGFAPRIVVLKEGKAVFDQVVPFLTERSSEAGVTFEGDFTIEKEGLKVKGAVSLDSLDEQMRGHAKLPLLVTRGETVLGNGDLVPGYFADLKEGYRIGFAGLKKWSEIDISRKNYPLPIFAGAGMMLIGAILLPVALWRKW